MIDSNPCPLSLARRKRGKYGDQTEERERGSGIIAGQYNLLARVSSIIIYWKELLTLTRNTLMWYLLKCVWHVIYLQGVTETVQCHEIIWNVLHIEIYPAHLIIGGFLRRKHSGNKVGNLQTQQVSWSVQESKPAVTVQFYLVSSMFPYTMKAPICCSGMLYWNCTWNN